MKTPFLFLSDFDGTMSEVDFYHTFVDTYFPGYDNELREQVLSREITSFGFLQKIFSRINLSESELSNHINDITLCEGTKELIKTVQESGGEFAVVSAGSSYYIDPVLDSLELGEIALYSNGGRYSNGSIDMTIPENSKLRHWFYGIDKLSVLQSLRPKYSQIIYAGDGSADYEAAAESDIRFAKVGSSLEKKLRLSNLEHIPFESFAEINKILKKTLL